MGYFLKVIRPNVPKIKWLWRGKGADKIRYILKSGQYKMKKKRVKKGECGRRIMFELSKGWMLLLSFFTEKKEKKCHRCYLRGRRRYVGVYLKNKNINKGGR